MDILRLNSTTYLPEEFVEGFSSKIWTERHLDPGDFQFNTGDIERVRTLLPKGSLVALLDSREVQIVETLKITKNRLNGEAQLTITGRTFETFLEQRGTTYGNADYDPDSTGVPAATWFPLTTLINTINEALNGDSSHTGDRIPNFQVNSSITFLTSEDADTYTDAVSAYDFALGIMSRKGWGIQNIRPLASGNKLTMQIYAGINRAVISGSAPPWGAGDSGDPMVFRDDLGDFPSPTFVDTNKDFKNIAQVESPLGRRLITAPGWNSLTAVGFNRRILFVDASSVTKIGSGDTLTKKLTRIGQKALAQHNKTLYFDAEVNRLTNYTYGVDYGLGDIVGVKAEYGIRENLLVNEYIRTEDENGERGFPSLVLRS